MRAFASFGGSPAAVVPDNLKSGVPRADRYDPDLNPAYQEFARHYGLAILPARVRKPRDKATVESGVLLVERWILARLCDATFFSPAALNDAIRALVAELNQKPFQKREGTGVCKSWIACAIGHAACRIDHTVRFYRLPRLVDEITRATAMNNRSSFFRSLAKVDLLTDP